MNILNSDKVYHVTWLNVNLGKIIGYEHGEDYHDKIQSKMEVYAFDKKICSSCKHKVIEYRSISERIGKYCGEDCAKKIGGEWRKIKDVISMLRRPIIDLKKAIFQRQLYYDFIEKK